MKKNPFLTIMIIPHTEDGPKSLKISIHFIRVVGFLMILALMFSFLWMYDYTYLSRQNESYIFAQKKDKDLIKNYSKDYLALFQDVKDLKEKLVSVESLEEKIRKENGFDPTISFFSKKNQTVMTEVESKGKSKAIASANNLTSIKEAKTDVDIMKEALPEKEKSLNELIRLMEDRNEALLSIPSIYPTVGRITSGFGYRRDPFNYRLSFHDGLDIANSYGTPINATADGIVTFAGYNGGFGNEVIINHGNGYITYYPHTSRYIVDVGDFVRKGQIIAYMGSTGRSTGPHVHYMIKKNGTLVNPVNYLN